MGSLRISLYGTSLCCHCSGKVELIDLPDDWEQRTLEEKEEFVKECFWEIVNYGWHEEDN